MERPQQCIDWYPKILGKNSVSKMPGGVDHSDIFETLSSFWLVGIDLKYIISPNLH